MLGGARAESNFGAGPNIITKNARHKWKRHPVHLYLQSQLVDISREKRVQDNNSAALLLLVDTNGTHFLLQMMNAVIGVQPMRFLV